MSMKDVKIVGILGRKGSGKDTIAEALKDLGFVQESFAKPVYEEVAAAFGVTVELLSRRETKETPMSELDLGKCKDATFVAAAYVALYKEFGPNASISLPLPSDVLGLKGIYLSPRKALQLWGTEYRRQQDNHYWVKKLHDRIEASGAKLVVISDVREPMEAAWVKRQDNGLVLKVIRPGNPYEGGELANHSSETLVDAIAFDLDVYNEDTVTQLQEDAVELVSHWFEL